MDASVAAAKSCAPSQLQRRIAKRKARATRNAPSASPSSTSRSRRRMVAFHATNEIRASPRASPPTRGRGWPPARRRQGWSPRSERRKTKPREAAQRENAAQESLTRGTSESAFTRFLSPRSWDGPVLAIGKQAVNCKNTTYFRRFLSIGLERAAHQYSVRPVLTCLPGRQQIVRVPG